MLFSRWFRRRSRPARAFRPAVLLLEDRTVPSGFGHWFPPAGPATHLQVIVPEQVQSARSFDVLVAALDASNHLATGCAGTVGLSLGTADAGATLPGAYTFTANDFGVHRFHVTLSAVGSQTIIATDAATASITGSAATTVNPIPVPTSLKIETASQAAVGIATRVEVEVLDQSGHVIPSYTGTVTLDSPTDPTATAAPGKKATASKVPITYTFTARDHGEHTFAVTFDAAGAQTLTASGTVPGATGTIAAPQANVTVYPPTVVTHFGVFALPLAVTGSPVPVVIEALNAANQVVSGYAGTVTLTSTDTAATASATRGGTATSLANFTYAFTSGDAGKHVFRVTFGTAGRQTLTATDSATSSGNPTITGSLDFNVLSQLPGRHHFH